MKEKANAERPRSLSGKKIAVRTAVSLFTACSVILLGLLGCVYIVEFGPSKTARNLFVNSAMESSAGKFLATLFFSEEEIRQMREANSVQSADAVTDTTLLQFTSDDHETGTNADTVQTGGEDGANGQEDGHQPENSSGIEIIDIAGDTYKGKLMIVKDPSRVTVGVSGAYGEEYSGRTVMQMAQDYNAAAAVNGGGFEDTNGVGNGGTPIGLVISEGKLKYGSAGSSYEVIGFDHNNALVVGRMTAQEALNRGVRDALSFGPILIVNGEAAQVKGAGSGLNPRTAIGQRTDGAVLLLVIDGRQVNSLGASYADIIEIMLAYGAVNAANLDGGSSSLMYYDGAYINNCASLYGPRNMPTCIIVK